MFGCSAQRWTAVVSLLVAGPVASAELPDPVPREAGLETTGGTAVLISSTRGKPVALFYEDKDSWSWNAALKEELVQRGRERGRLDAVRMIPVANVRGFDFFPARGFALSALRGVEKKIRLPMWIDWKGVLQREPWRLPADGSTVVLLDAEGRVRFQQTGRLDAADRARFFAALEPLVRSMRSAPPSP